MDIQDIQNWTNKNAGLLALLLFMATSLGTLAVWCCQKVIRRKTYKPSLSINVFEQPTLCSTFDTGKHTQLENCQRTAFLIYLEIKNDGKVPVQIGDIHLGYKSQADDNLESWHWLKHEIVLLEDYAVPIGDKVKVFPFLKQKNRLIDNDTNTYLKPGETRNGLVYFEQEKSSGLNFPYMEPDYKVQTIVVVHDSDGNKWIHEHRVIKVKIDPIREICPSFGLTRESCEDGD